MRLNSEFSRGLLLVLVVGTSGLKGCAQIDVPETTGEAVPKLSNDWRYEVFAKHGPSSPLRNTVDGYACTVQFVVAVTEVHEFDAWNPHAGVTLIDRETEELGSLLFASDRKAKTVVPYLLKSDPREIKPLELSFELGELIHAQMYFAQESAAVALVGNSELKGLKPEAVREKFQFAQLDLGFQPTEVEFYGAGVDAVFEQMSVQRDCPAP